MQSHELQTAIHKPNVIVPPMFILCARQGQGKTFQAKKLLQESGMVGVILDLNHEYDANKNIIFTDVNYFLDYVATVSDCFVIIDEANSVLSSMPQREIISLLLRCRHRRVSLALCYHAVNRIAKYVLDMGNGYCWLGVTNDDEQSIASSRPKLLPYFLEVKKTQTAMWIDLNNIN